MVYTVGEMARLLNVPASTLRYYDKEGLLPFVERSSGGIRMFKDSDYEWLQVIGCLKKAGMSIRDIRQYILLAMQGDSTIGDRLQMFYAQRERLLEQMEQLRQTLDTLNYKCWFYEQAKACGSTEAVSCIVPEEYRVRGQPSSRCAAFRREQLIAEIKMRGAHRNPLQMLHE